MTHLFLAFAITVLSVLGLALGVILGRPPLKGSCGGLSCAVPGGCAACPGSKANGGSDE